MTTSGVSWHTVSLTFGAAVELFRVEQPDTGQLVVHLRSKTDVVPHAEYRLTRLVPSEHFPMTSDPGELTGTSLAMPFTACYGPEAVTSLASELGITLDTTEEVERRETEHTSCDNLEVAPANENEGQTLSSLQATHLESYALPDFLSFGTTEQHDPGGSNYFCTMQPDVKGSIEDVAMRTGGQVTTVNPTISQPPRSRKRQRQPKRPRVSTVVPIAPNTMATVSNHPLQAHLAVLAAAAANHLPPLAPPLANEIGGQGAVTMSDQMVALEPLLSEDTACSLTVNAHTCQECGLEFNRLCNLQRHILLVHGKKEDCGPPSPKKRPLNSKECPLCGVMKCRQYKQLVEHVAAVHRVVATIERAEFAGSSAFFGWKRALEAQTGNMFVQRSGSKPVKESVNTYFACCAKLTNGIAGGTCIAFIRTAQSKETGRIQATYCLTHLGH